ncbi:MAG: molybdopterin-dependent oxidoreductase [Salinirussus sp.]
MLRRALAGLEPRPAVVDAAILGLLGFEVVSGLVSLIGGTPDWAWLFAAHAIAGVTLVVLVTWKLRRVWPRLRSSAGRPDHLASSVALTILAVCTLAAGIAWSMLDVVRIGGYTLLTVHMVLGLLVVPVLIWHLRHRFRLPTERDLEGRRTMLQFAATVGAAAVAWRLSDTIARLGGLFRADERFTGSKDAGGSGNDYPVTMWVADDPAPIDVDEWQLSVTGHVDSPLSVSYGDLLGNEAAVGTESALLDCTSGWYAERQWTGVGLAEVAALADPTDEATWVVVRSVTGYRWSFPLSAADDLLLATHVDGERLSHGHGAPLRLVAPGRRGFQWVKWVESIEVRRRRDLSQWIAIFVSGFT